MAGRCRAGVRSVRPRRRVAFSFGVHAAVFQAEIFAILAHARDCIERNYVKKRVHII
jgi:hypothetical protein